MQEPTKDYLGIMQNSITPEFPFHQESEGIAAGIKQVIDYMSKQDVLSEAVFDNLHWDYTRLFVGPYELPAPPWESAYCNEERLLFQKETHEVRQAYLKYAFLPVEFGKEADDHLGLELDFMFQLTSLALEAADRKNIKLLKQILADQKLFLKEHLLKWIPSLCADIIKSAHTEFYQGMAKLLQGFLTLEPKALEELLERVQCGEENHEFN
ncbi:MAG TPA: molecular chaperone TorD family protein [Patescibacteria group bacterium]|nr:molecular chaperone TorD family protein [Patescibacteria group bacterium]